MNTDIYDLISAHIRAAMREQGHAPGGVEPGKMESTCKDCGMVARAIEVNHSWRIIGEAATRACLVKEAAKP